VQWIAARSQVLRRVQQLLLHVARGDWLTNKRCCGCSAHAGLPRLFAGTDKSLSAFDSKTSDRMWSFTFPAMPISAHRQDGVGGNYLDPSNAWARSGIVPSSSTGLAPHSQLHPLAHKQPRRQQQQQQQGQQGGTVLVGALPGSILYALPADHLMLAADEETGLPHTGTTVWPNRVGSLPMDITPADAGGICDVAGAAADGIADGRRSGSAGRPMLPAPLPADGARAPATDGSRGREASGSSSSDEGTCDGPDGSCSDGSSSSGSNSTSLALLDERSLVALDASEGGLIAELDSLTCPQPPLGIHSIQTQQLPQAVAWLPEASSTKVGGAVHEGSS
jgi:hypothetical protein